MFQLKEEVNLLPDYIQILIKQEWAVKQSAMLLLLVSAWWPAAPLLMDTAFLLQTQWGKSFHLATLEPCSCMLCVCVCACAHTSVGLWGCKRVRVCKNVGLCVNVRKLMCVFQQYILQGISLDRFDGNICRLKLWNQILTFPSFVFLKTSFSRYNYGCLCRNLAK